MNPGELLIHFEVSRHLNPGGGGWTLKFFSVVFSVFKLTKCGAAFWGHRFPGWLVVGIGDLCAQPVGCGGQGGCLKRSHGFSASSDWALSGRRLEKAADQSRLPTRVRSPSVLFGLTLSVGFFTGTPATPSPLRPCLLPLATRCRGTGSSGTRGCWTHARGGFSLSHTPHPSVGRMTDVQVPGSYGPAPGDLGAQKGTGRQGQREPLPFRPGKRPSP